MKKILTWTVAGIVSIGGFAACGSDDDDKSPETTAASEATTGETTAPGDSTATTAAGGDTSAVDTFCADVESLVEAGPTASDYATKLQELIAQGSAVGAEVAGDADASAKLQECLTELTTTGG